MKVTSAPSNAPRVLVIDDDPLVTVVVRRALEGIPARLQSASGAGTGLQSIEQSSPDLIVLDNVLPDALGIDVLKQIHDLAPTVPVLFVTARGSGSTAIEAMKLCAFDYLPKPLDPLKLRGQLQRALSFRELVAPGDPEAESPTAYPRAHEHPDLAPVRDALVGECPAMQTVFKSVGKVAGQNVTVLVRGEHGTGKEAIAREIHKHSRFADGPVLKVHCPGATEERLDAELFGVGGTAGQIEEASGGTLLLQEVGLLPVALQSKLLQVLRDRSFHRLDDSVARPVECRVIAITSEPLDDLVRNGQFRSDLYYALGSFVIALPPLRQRRGDLPLLITHTVGKLQPIYAEFGVIHPRISPEAMQTLCDHVWPGNIDELESVLKRALVEQKGHILLASDLKQSLGEAPRATTADSGERVEISTDWSTFAQLRIESGTDTLHADATEEMERKLFARVLLHTGGNQAQAARILGITRASLRKRLRQYGMAAKPIAPE